VKKEKNPAKKALYSHAQSVIASSAFTLTKREKLMPRPRMEMVEKISQEWKKNPQGK
jgi:hypothetical protein